MAQSARHLNANILKDYLQTIPITAVEINAEVVALKDEIINAAHKHRLTIDRDETQPDNPFNTPENQKRLIAIVEKQKEIVTTRVG